MKRRHWLAAPLLAGACLAPVPWSTVLTPRTSSARMSLRDGQPISLAVANPTRVVVAIERRN